MRRKQIPAWLIACFLLAAVYAPVGQRAATNHVAALPGLAAATQGPAGAIRLRVNGSYDYRVIPSRSRVLRIDLSRPQPAPDWTHRNPAELLLSVDDLPGIRRSFPAAAHFARAADTSLAQPTLASNATPSDGIAGITRVSILPGNSGDTVIDVGTTKPVQFTPFRLENPMRVVVDLQKTVAPHPQELYPSERGVLRDVRVAQFSVRPSPVTRVVADLSGNEPSNVELGPRGVRIQIRTSGVPATSSRLVLHPVPVSSSPIPAITERGGNEKPAPGVTSQAVELVNLTRPVKVDWEMARQSPSANAPLAARALSAALPAHSAAGAANPLVHRVAENVPLPQAVEAVRAAQVVAGATQAQGQQPIESTIFSTPSFQQAAPVYTGKLISLDLVNADIRTFFRLIHRISGLNIVVDSDVTGTVTLVLDDVPWDQALDLVLKNNNLGKIFEGNVLRIAKVQTLTGEAQSQATLREAKLESEPLVTVFRRLKYAHVCDQTQSMGASGGGGGGAGGGAAGGGMGQCGGAGGGGGMGGVPGVATILKKFQKGTVLSDRGSIVEDPRDNAIIITDVPSQIPVIESVVNKLDTKSKQISIQVRVILASATFSRTLSSVLGASLRNPSGTTRGAAGTGQGIIGTANVPPPLPSLSAITQPASVGASGFGAFAITNAGARYAINAAITAAEEHDQARTISRPTIVTQDNVLGEVQQGVQIPIQTDINNTIAVQYVNATLMLSVTPQVTVDNKVFLNIYVNNASIGSISTFVGPTINTQQATTQVLVPDGGTVVFGGITVTTRGHSATYVPLLGSIPVVGNLFKSTAVNDQNQELLFFVTPMVLPG